MHMYATLAMGDAGQSHKNVDESRSWILKQYYSNNVSYSHPVSGEVEALLMRNRKSFSPSVR
jgi:transcriptional regulator of NAD metabolism